MAWMIGLAAALVSAVIGGVVGYLLHDRRSRGALADARTAQALAEQQRAQLQVLHEESARELRDCRTQLSGAREEVAATVSETRLLREQNDLLACREAELSARCTAAGNDLAAARAERDAARQQLEEQKQAVSNALDQMRASFASLSQAALQSNNDAFLTLASTRFEQLAAQANGTLDERKAQIETLLRPLQETLGAYQRRLSEIEASRQEGYGKLMEQLGSVGEIGRNLERQTTQLATALRRPTGGGQWGELTLRRLVELAGMSRHCDFTEQATVASDDARQRPDMIVQLPNGRTIIVDSKVSVEKFLEAAACQDESRRCALLDAHAGHVRGRCRELAQRAYWNQFEQSPDFVVMFLPGEAFLYAAVEREPTIIEDGMKDHVVIATPTTLIALLKAVEYGWRQESMTQNAEEIRRLGVELYERIAIVSSHIGALGERLRASVQAYNTTVGSFTSRVEVTARKLSELGARNERELEMPEPLDVQPRLAATVDAEL